MTSSVRLLFTALSCCACLVPVAGCGGGSQDTSGDEDEVRAVIQRLEDAALSGDGAAICNDLFTAGLKSSVGRASGRPCEREVTRRLFSQEAEFQVTDVSIDGERATVRVVDQFDQASVISLLKQEGEWRISGVS